MSENILIPDYIKWVSGQVEVDPIEMQAFLTGDNSVIRQYVRGERSHRDPLVMKAWKLEIEILLKNVNVAIDKSGIHIEKMAKLLGSAFGVALDDNEVRPLDAINDGVIRELGQSAKYLGKLNDLRKTMEELIVTKGEEITARELEVAAAIKEEDMIRAKHPVVVEYDCQECKKKVPINIINLDPEMFKRTNYKLIIMYNDGKSFVIPDKHHGNHHCVSVVGEYNPWTNADFAEHVGEVVYGKDLTITWK